MVVAERELTAEEEEEEADPCAEEEPFEGRLLPLPLLPPLGPCACVSHLGQTCSALLSLTLLCASAQDLCSTWRQKKTITPPGPLPVAVAPLPAAEEEEEEEEAESTSTSQRQHFAPSGTAMALFLLLLSLSLSALQSFLRIVVQPRITLCCNSQSERIVINLFFK